MRFKKDIFKKDNDISTTLSSEFTLPLVNAKAGNNGIMYYGRRADFESEEMTIDIVNDGAISTGNVYPQPQHTGVLYNAYLIKSEEVNTLERLYFFATVIEKSIKKKFGYENKAGWEKVQEESIKVPIKGKDIDFDFIDCFMSDLEAQHLVGLDRYLYITGLSNYELSEEERRALKLLEDSKVEFAERPITDIFDIKNTQSILSKDVNFVELGKPYVTAGAENNSIAGYVEYDEKFIDKGNCVFIGGKTFVVTYQSEDFYSNDSHNLALYNKNSKCVNRLNQLYLVTCVQKSLQHQYSWGDSVSNKKISDDFITVPINQGEIDYHHMNLLISAVQKLVIKDVVLYVRQKVNSTKIIIGKSE